MGSMFETLLGTPLFTGVSHQKISEIVGKHKFHFLKYSDSETIVDEGEQCTHIKTIITGEARLTISNKSKRFRVSQTLQAPAVICPDFFFGKITHYPGVVKAVGEVGVMQIDKSDFMHIINSDPIFLFNYLNLLSMNAQLAVEGVLAITSGSLEQRLAYWIVALTQINGKDIVLECRQKDMYTVFGVPRQSLIAALDNLQKQGIIEYSPQMIKVLDRRSLVELLSL
jgi:CRP-like cAMP-binding protein